MPQVRYQVLSPLMSGEGSRAFLALELRNETQALPSVLVWVPEQVLADPEVFAELKRETARAAQLEHPHITRVHGLAMVDEGVARVVEFLDGESLRRILEVARRLPVSIAARIIADAATGAHYAHVAGNDDGSPLCHGDIRPETLMVSFSGIAKVAGYGALAVAPRESGGERVKGRRKYSAPEQVVGGRHAIARSSDVYLLGLCLYECLSGHPPFHDEEDQDRAIIEKELPAIDDVPAAYNAIIARATQKRAAARYKTALELREALEAAGALADQTEIASFLEGHFPRGEAPQATRRQIVDRAVSEFNQARAQVQVVRMPSTPSTAAPPPTALSDTNAELPRARPLPLRSPKSRALSAPDDSLDDHRAVQRRHQARTMYAIAIAGSLVLVGIIVMSGRSDRSKPTAIETLEREATAPPPSPPPRAAPAAEAKEPPPPAGPPQAPPALTATLEVVAEPECEVLVDGKSVGRSPVTAQVPPGRHVVRLTDPEKGVNVTRVVHVASGGTQKLELALRRGYLSVNAPEGAQASLDGKVIDIHDAREVSIYEGEHKLVVTMGKAKWEQKFRLRPDEHLSFDVQGESTPVASPSPP